MLSYVFNINEFYILLYLLTAKRRLHSLVNNVNNIQVSPGNLTNAITLILFNTTNLFIYNNFYDFTL